MPKGVYARKPRTRINPSPTSPPPPAAPPRPVPVNSEPVGAIRVVLVRRRGLGSNPEERMISWPPAWRLPQNGESVLLDDGWGGFIEYVAFDLDRNVIRVNLR